MNHNAEKSLTTGKFRFFAKSAVRVIEEIKFTQFDFSIAKSKGKWTVDSESKLEVLDKPIDTGFDYQYNGGQKLNIFMKSTDPLLDVNFLQFNVDKFAIDIEKKEKKTNWSVSSDTTLKIDPDEHWDKPVIDFKGNIKLQKQESTWGLALTPDHSKIDIPLVEGDNSTSFEFDFDPFTFNYNSETKKWDLKAGVNAKLTKLPDELRNTLPKPLNDLLTNGIHPFFEATQESISIGVKDLFDSGSIDADIKLVDSHGQPVTDIDLGKFAVNVSDFKLTLSEALTLSADFGIALPSKLNYIFGKKDETTPKRNTV